MSYKTEVIEQLFEHRWDGGSRTLRSPIVTFKDLQVGIGEFNERHGTAWSTANPANFFKDLIRNTRNANTNWPRSVFDRGYTGRQLTAGGNSFEFILLAENQVVAFPEDTLPQPDKETKRFQVESVSLPLASKRLGRGDEPWLIQVLIRLRVFETHLALTSQQKFVQIDHLQTNIKLNGAEIDALFLAVLRGDGGTHREVIVCCEAKGRRDDIVLHQILNQVRAAFRMKIEQDVVIPLAVKAIAPSEIWVVEFQPVSRHEAPDLEALTVATSAIYQLVPPVPGIGI